MRANFPSFEGWAAFGFCSRLLDAEHSVLVAGNFLAVVDDDLGDDVVRIRPADRDSFMMSSTFRPCVIFFFGSAATGRDGGLLAAPLLGRLAGSATMDDAQAGKG